MAIDAKIIARINELYHKSKETGLTEKEAEEQKKLREQYIAAIRTNMRATLNQVAILEPDGSVTELKQFDRTKRTES